MRPKSLGPGDTPSDKVAPLRMIHKESSSGLADGTYDVGMAGFTTESPNRWDTFSGGATTAYVFAG